MRIEKFVVRSQVTRVLDPRVARDFVLYHGGEIENGFRAVQRAAIHQGPHVTRQFRETGRLSLFVAVMNFAP